MRLKKIDATGKPYQIYAEHLESGAIDQFIEVMQLDCVVQGALMPDAHKGYSLPTGAVIAAEGAVFPSFVGYDIGCGVCAVPTSFNRGDIVANKKVIFDQIYRDVPVGFAHNARGAEWTYAGQTSAKVQDVLKNGGLRQLGTLGGGNHFIELGYDEHDRIWIVIHSGSRNVGHKIATHYMTLAADLRRIEQGQPPEGKAREGAFALKVGSKEGQDYIADLAFGLAFALQNRLSMVHRIEAAIQRTVPGNANYAELINRNHNHAEQDAAGRWIHRKGATHAELGMMGVIPGSMRDGSFIVRGKGNPDSLCSSSHGAGRVMGRAEAKRTLDMATFQAEMAERGIQALVNESTLDESAGAYKSIFEVMALQQDLVEVIHHIKPLINIKGGKED